MKNPQWTTRKLCKKSTVQQSKTTAAVPQWVRAFVLQANVWMFESQLRETNLSHKNRYDSSTAIRLAIGVSVTGP